MSIQNVKAIVFDTFGTISDWRSSIAREAEIIAAAKGVEGYSEAALHGEFWWLLAAHAMPEMG